MPTHDELSAALRSARGRNGQTCALMNWQVEALADAVFALFAVEPGVAVPEPDEQHRVEMHPSRSCCVSGSPRGPAVKLRVSGSSLWMWCPACEDAHRITVGTPDSWTWDGNTEQPTISPSIKVTGAQWSPEFEFYKPNHNVEPGSATCCHSFLRNGVWEFLGDCTHTMAGQHVPMVDLPDWLAQEDQRPCQHCGHYHQRLCLTDNPHLDCDCPGRTG